MSVLKIPGVIEDYDGEFITIIAPLSDYEFLARHNVKVCEVRFSDGRTISAEQRKHIYATLRDIALWTGFSADEMKPVMKYLYITKTGCDYFSLSDCDMTAAREFLEYLIEFCVENGVPCTESLSGRTSEITRYLYACVLARKCAVCGRKADIHEVDHAGMGRNRRKIHHSGQRVQPLCRKHHNEAGSMGQKSFDDKYHLTWVKLDDHACEILNWRK